MIYKRTGGTGLNAVFGSREPGVGYEAVGMVLFVLVWICAGGLFFSRPGYEQFQGFLPIPTIKALWVTLFEAKFWISVRMSLQRVVAGIALAGMIGVPAGLVIGFYPRLRKLTHSPVQFLRMISPLSWMPVALLVFTSFESAVVFLIVMATVWPIILNTAIGVMNVNPRWIKMAVNQGADHFQLMRTIVIPASIPYMVTSFRLALGVAWIVLVPAEFLGISSGLGYLINDARDTMAYDRLMAIIIVIGIIGFLLDRLLQKIQTVFDWSWIE